MRLPAALRTLTNKLALVFVAVVAVACAIVFFYVVPQLRSNLEQQVLHDLDRSARQASAPIRRSMGTDVDVDRLDELVRAAADAADARLTLFAVQRSEPGERLTPYVISDSRVDARIPVTADIASRALAGGGTEQGIGSDGARRAAQVAQPLTYRGRSEWVALYSRDLADVSDAVAVVRNQVLFASALALLLAVVGGWLVARALSRRVRRLETGARQVAAGNYFVEPLPVDSDDELGQLTAAFNEMRDRLARVDRARREFIANASHELRTPIFSLGGFAELLQDEDLDPETRHEFLDQMREQIARLQKLSVDLLDLSRLDAGSLELHPEPVELGALARAIASEFTPTLSRGDTRLELDLDGGAEAWCDRERVAQIVRILVDNALRHTPEGTRVTIATARADGGARLSVADTGPSLAGKGIDPESAPQLFERFYTADAASGSGLGLAIARELAERMGGRIVLEAESGRTVFTLALPAATRARARA